MIFLDESNIPFKMIEDNPNPTHYKIPRSAKILLDKKSLQYSETYLCYLQFGNDYFAGFDKSKPPTYYIL